MRSKRTNSSSASAKPYVVAFGGAPGSSKSIVAHYLSMEFYLPLLNRDIIRSEVKEEFLVANINEPRALVEFERRFTDRWEEALAMGQPFILDGSVDRSWSRTKAELLSAGFSWFMINMELSHEFFMKLFAATRRQKGIEQLDGYLEQHRAFVEKYSTDINLNITDTAFDQRIHLAAAALSDFLSARRQTVSSGSKQ